MGTEFVFAGPLAAVGRPRKSSFLSADQLHGHDFRHNQRHSFQILSRAGVRTVNDFRLDIALHAPLKFSAWQRPLPLCCSSAPWRRSFGCRTPAVKSFHWPTSETRPHCWLFSCATIVLM